MRAGGSLFIIHCLKRFGSSGCKVSHKPQIHNPLHCTNNKTLRAVDRWQNASWCPSMYHRASRNALTSLSPNEWLSLGCSFSFFNTSKCNKPLYSLSFLFLALTGSSNCFPNCIVMLRDNKDYKSISFHPNSTSWRLSFIHKKASGTY